MPEAARLVAELQQVPPEKLLADELEVVQAVRDLMDCQPESVETTARHIAERSADPLSCEVGAVLVRPTGALVAEVVTRDWPARLDPDAIRATLVRLFAPRRERAPCSSRSSRPRRTTRSAATRGWWRDSPCPSAGSSRSACSSSPTRRPGRAGSRTCASGSGMRSPTPPSRCSSRRSSREALAQERDRFAREARTDPLTGLENRTGWDQLLANEEDRAGRAIRRRSSIVSADLDGLKTINDRDGHEAGDRAIAAAAELLRTAARDVDHVARVGGDEFLVLLPETDDAGAERFVQRVRAGRPEDDV